MKKTGTKTFVVIAICLYLCSAFMAFKGYDKMTNYYHSENYYSLNKNAYVGGDAYNYIINGTYATSYFVLSMGFMIAGTVFFGVNQISKTLYECFAKEEDKPKDLVLEPQQVAETNSESERTSVESSEQNSTSS